MNQSKIIAIALMIFCAPVFGAKLEAIFDRGATWNLVIDDWDGAMEVIDQASSVDSSGARVVQVKVKWKGKYGKLDVREFKTGRNRPVTLQIPLPSGEQIVAEGFIARESDVFMAGTTRYSGKKGTISGAWYATALTANATSTIKNQGSKVTSQSAYKGQMVIDVPVATVQATCRLQGMVDGQIEDVQGAWLQPEQQGQSGISIALDQGWRFDIQIPAGVYLFRVVPKGKLSLDGPGVAQTVDCPAGGTIRLIATVNLVGD